jgi:hypothetical protein
VQVSPENDLELHEFRDISTEIPDLHSFWNRPPLPSNGGPPWPSYVGLPWLSDLLPWPSDDEPSCSSNGRPDFWEHIWPNGLPSSEGIFMEDG